MKKTKKTLSLKQEDRKVINLKTMLNYVCTDLKDGNYDSAEKTANILSGKMGSTKTSPKLKSPEKIEKIVGLFTYKFFNLNASIDNLITAHSSFNRQVLSQYNINLETQYNSYFDTYNPPILAYQMLSHGNYHKFYRLMESQVAFWIVLGNIIIHDLRTEIHHKLYRYSQMKYISIDKIYHEINKMPIGYEKCNTYLGNMRTRCNDLLIKLNNDGTVNMSMYEKHEINEQLCNMLGNNGIYTCNALKFISHTPNEFIFPV